MFVGLNAGFGRQLGADRAFIEATGFTLVRQEFRVGFSDRDIAALVHEFVGRPLTLLALIGGGTNRGPRGGRIEPHQFAELASRVVHVASDAGLNAFAIEIGNEPDIGHHDYATRPQDFAVAVAQSHAAVRQAGHTGMTLSGGISNLSRERLDYLARMTAHGLPPDVVIGFHRYPHGMSPTVPHPGFKNRDEEWRRLLEIAGTRRVACTEFGHHTARRRQARLGWLRPQRRMPEAAVAEHIVYDYQFFLERAAVIAAVYQINDGPTDGAIDRYGIRRRDGTPKPAVAAIATFIAGGTQKTTNS